MICLNLLYSTYCKFADPIVLGDAVLMVHRISLSKYMRDGKNPIRIGKDVLDMFVFRRMANV